VVYLDAAMEMMERKNPGKEVVPAGIFYYHIDDPVIDGEEVVEKEDIDRAILKKLRMDGLVNSEQEVISLMDREIGKASDVIPVAVKDGLIQEAKSSVANRERFAALEAFVGNKLKEGGLEILSGRVGIRPYKQGNRTACDYCPYHGVCGFDSRIQGFDYRKLKSRKPEELWEEIEKQSGKEER